MVNGKKLLSFVTAMTIASTTAPVVFASESLEISCALNGNNGATIEANCSVNATTDDSDLVSISVSGKTVNVSAVEDAVGLATVTISNGSETENVEIPVGYTTFVFDDDTLTVIKGSDTNYEITGVNSADEEYAVGSSDAAYELPTSTDADGNLVYENTDAYKINVGVKKKGGSYVFYGDSDDMSIAVKKEATKDATLMFAGLDLTSSFTAPLTIKKNSSACVYLDVLEGYENTLSDADFNNADSYGDTEDGGDGTNVEYAESAVIKGKDYANLTIQGEGVLNLNCATKNAIKVGEYGSLTIEDVTLNVDSVKNGISSDNMMYINSGNINVVAEADGIRTDPDAVNSEAGTAADIEITGGSINIKSGSDGIQSANNLTISGGTFDITAGEGYNDSNFDKDTMSCKGLKASYNGDDEDADTTESTNTITVTGGSFTLNCADDAVHSDAYIAITGGDFDIKTGDDAVHADTTLDLGTDGDDNDNLSITVETCYEALEAGTVYINSGTYNLTASDDGINAAGGSDSTDQAETGFNPGGQRPGGGNTNQGTGSTSSDYSINISGGNIYVNSDGDGLDSNGALNLTGGKIVVWGQQSGGDNEPLDCDGGCIFTEQPYLQQDQVL